MIQINQEGDIYKEYRFVACATRRWRHL